MVAGAELVVHGVRSCSTLALQRFIGMAVVGLARARRNGAHGRARAARPSRASVGNVVGTA